MEVATRVLPSVITKLGELLVGEYNLQKEVKGGIIFLQAELESIKGALEKISNTPTDELDEQIKIWARAVRELSYDIEDKVDTFMVRCNGSKKSNQHGFKKVIDRGLHLLMQPMIRRMIATDIRDIKTSVKEVSKRRDRYRVNTNDVSKPVKIDPRLFTRYEKVVELIGIDKIRDEVIKILGEDNEVSKKQDKIVSIVGFGGLGKTTLASVVYETVRAGFDCSAFVSVSQTPDMDKLFKDMLYQFAKRSNSRINVIEELREFLEHKRYIIVIDDIWDIVAWKMIKCALPDNNVGCKIITTSRILSVGRQAGDVYNLKPLSLQNSRKLLYRRVFGNKSIHDKEDMENCPYQDLAIVSDKILKKCAGVPLAINTMASLLACKGKDKMDWYEVYNSIGTGMENSQDAENMRKILSYSYYDLPSHLKTCLLYLSMFPEDFEIEKDRLIWLWRAEGLIQYKEQGKCLYEIGESYFNELINRSLTQPVVTGYNDECPMIEACRVHDMVLGLLCSISSEENFISVLSGGNHTYAPTTTRRLSIQIQGIPSSFPKLRSIVSFTFVPNAMSFNILRVLDLQDCKLGEGYHLKYLTKLFHLRYLGLSGTKIKKLPQEVVSLQFLETLNIYECELSCLPSTIVQLRKLMCISIYQDTRVPNGIGSLESLEHLSWLYIDDGSMDHIEGLGLLSELRVLRIVLYTDKWNDKLVMSLLKLRKIEHLDIKVRFMKFQRNVAGLDEWVIPRRLRRLATGNMCWFLRLPAWMNNPGHFVDLCDLCIAVKEMQQKDLDVLGRLPALYYLQLEVDHEDLGIHVAWVVGADVFPCLVLCSLGGSVVPLVFHQGAMPRVRHLDFDFHVRAVREIASSGGGFDLGLGNLPSLMRVGTLFKGSSIKEDFKEANAVLKQATETHPNRPSYTPCIRTDEGLFNFDKSQMRG